MYGNVCRKKKKDSEEHYDDIWYYVCKHRRTVGSIPCTFNTYVRQEDIISEVLGIVKELFDRENISEYLAKDFLAESLDINKLQDDLKKLTKNKQKIEEKKTKLLAKIAEMDPGDPLYDDIFSNYNGLIRGFASDIADLNDQITEVKANIDTNGARRASVEVMKKTISSMRDRIDELSDEAVKKFLNSFIDRINMLEKPDVINGQKFWVDSVKFKVPFYKGTPKEFVTIKANR